MVRGKGRSVMIASDYGRLRHKYPVVCELPYCSETRKQILVLFVLAVQTWSFGLLHGIVVWTSMDKPGLV